MLDQREKAQRDCDWMLSTARKQGIQEGREEGTILGAIQALRRSWAMPFLALKNYPVIQTSN